MSLKLTSLLIAFPNFQYWDLRHLYQVHSLEIFYEDILKEDHCFTD